MKKHFLILLCLMAQAVCGQLKGNKDIQTTTMSLNNLQVLEIGLYAAIEINASGSNTMTITGDSNLIPLIDTEVVDGRMTLEQLEWIQPSQELQIQIEVNTLEHVQLSTNGTITVKGLDQEVFSAAALNGTIVLEGEVPNFRLNAENGTVNARKLSTASTTLNIWGWGHGLVNTDALVVQDLNQEASLTLQKQPSVVKGSIKQALRNATAEFSNTRYIRFKIKNNSGNRNNFYVVGPKPEGGKFSYGFPMMPGATRKENWTTGTKVYKVNALGLKKLLVEIVATNEGTTVPLF